MQFNVYQCCRQALWVGKAHMDWPRHVPVLTVKFLFSTYHIPHIDGDMGKTGVKVKKLGPR